MSVTFVVVPTLIAGWPYLCAAASVAAASLGFNIAKKEEVAQARETSVELEVDHSEILTEQLRGDEELILNRGDLKVRIYKDPRGQCALHIHGRGMSEEQLQEEGRKLVHKIKQQYVYQKVTQELKNRGFSIVKEEACEEGRIKIRYRKFD